MRTTEESTAKNQDADLLQVSAKGLIEAPKTAAGMVVPIKTAVTSVLSILGIVMTAGILVGEQNDTPPRFSRLACGNLCTEESGLLSVPTKPRYNDKMTQRENPFLKILRKPKKDRPVLDLAMTAGEVVSDTLTKGDALEAIPIVNLALKVVKAKDSIADSIYASKLVGFVNGIGDFTSEEREKAAAQFLKDDATKAGETVLLVLDRITDLDKPALLGFLFKQFAIGHITSEELRRLAVAVDIAFADDLRDFLTPRSQQVGSEEQQEDCRRRLTPTGLTFLHIEGGGFDAGSEPKYYSTRLGAAFFQLVNGSPSIDSIPSPGRRVAG